MKEKLRPSQIKKKVREFIASGPAPEDRLNGIHQAGMKGHQTVLQSHIKK